MFTSCGCFVVCLISKFDVGPQALLNKTLILHT